MNENQMKPVIWIGSSYEDWQTFPANVQDVMGYALHLAQCGKKAVNAKPLTGFKGASVLEIIDNYDSDSSCIYCSVSRCCLCSPCISKEK